MCACLVVTQVLCQDGNEALKVFAVSVHDLVKGHLADDWLAGALALVTACINVRPKKELLSGDGVARLRALHVFGHLIQVPTVFAGHR